MVFAHYPWVSCLTWYFLCYVCGSHYLWEWWMSSTGERFGWRSAKHWITKAGYQIKRNLHEPLGFLLYTDLRVHHHHQIKSKGCKACSVYAHFCGATMIQSNECNWNRDVEAHIIVWCLELSFVNTCQRGYRGLNTCFYKNQKCSW